MGNVNGPEVFADRGNFAFVTINLPKLAIESHQNIEEFFRLFDEYIELAKEYLLYRYSIIVKKKGKNFSFIVGQNIYLDSEKVGPEDTLEEVLKHASYSIGFCGLAECLVSLIGKHHGESEEAQELGLNIVKYLRNKTEEFKETTHFNFSTFASPAESTASTFAKDNRKRYGLIPGVTDKEYITNSSHVPVYFPICASKKIKIEAPYHKLCDAGHISYIEMDGDPLNNLEVFEKLVRAMCDADMGYISINHSVDMDPVCGYTGIIKDECPHCHRRETKHHSFGKIRREKQL